MLILLADVILLAQVDQIDDRLGCEEEKRVDDFDLCVLVSIEDGNGTLKIKRC
jgi:hypothetical protein